MKSSKKVIKIIGIVMLSTLLLGIISFSIILEPNFKINNWESLDENKLTKIERTLSILDKNDSLISDPIYDNNKIFVSIDKINRHTIDAFTSIEDRRFYEHNGIDYLRILSAIKTNLLSKSFKEGASTITQQLIKNTHLNNKKTIARKIQEMRIARDLERNFTKDEILEMYLNILYFGNNMYGIGTASKIMLNKSPQELSIAESALLAGIINNPSKFSPYKNMESAIGRKNLVLKQMLKFKKISKNDYDIALNENIILGDEQSNNHYFDAVINEACEILNCSQYELFKNNYIIGTNLSTDLQLEIEKLIKKNTPSNEEVNIEAIVIDNLSGNILTTNASSKHNLSKLKRPPGSTIKPLIAYAPALEKKLIYPTTPILDEQMGFGNYKPTNYNKKYYGWTTVEHSLINSLNIPAVKLLEMNGIEYSKSFCKKLGISFTKKDTSLTLALGGMSTGISLKELANAYTAFANNGKFVEAKYIRYITDKNNEIIYEHNPTNTIAMREDTAYMINEMLSKCAKSGTAKRIGIKNVCAKTGTVGDTNGNSDAYCIAYTPNYTIAAWYGNEDKKMNNTITGGGFPTILAKEILLLLDDKTIFNIPENIVKLKIDNKELMLNHKVLLADNKIQEKDKKTATFSKDNLPTQYSKQNKLDENYENFLDIRDLDFNNFQIVEGIINKVS